MVGHERVRAGMSEQGPLAAGLQRETDSAEVGRVASDQPMVHSERF
jgi:hypothetical protein